MNVLKIEGAYPAPLSVDLYLPNGAALPIGLCLYLRLQSSAGSFLVRVTNNYTIADEAPSVVPSRRRFKANVMFVVSHEDVTDKRHPPGSEIEGYLAELDKSIGGWWRAALL
jgi:hypothetical protein